MSGALGAAAAAGLADLVSELLGAPDLDEEGPERRAEALEFAIGVAAASGRVNALQRLLAGGAEVNQVDPRTGAFPLLMAAQAGHAEAVRDLVAAEAKVNQVDPVYGDFPLLKAAQQGHAEAGVCSHKPLAPSVW